MNEFFQKLISYNFWFGIDTGFYHKSDFVFLGLGALLVLAAIALQILMIKGVHPISIKPLQRVRNVLVWIGILEIFWFMLRWQFIPFFGTHFVALAILVIGIVWYAFAARYFLKAYHTDKKSFEDKEQKMKYMPNYKPHK